MALIIDYPSNEFESRCSEKKTYLPTDLIGIFYRCSHLPAIIQCFFGTNGHSKTIGRYATSKKYPSNLLEGMHFPKNDFQIHWKGSQFWEPTSTPPMQFAMYFFEFSYVWRCWHSLYRFSSFCFFFKIIIFLRFLFFLIF